MSGRVRYDLNKKQWYTVRDKLQKRGLWKYVEKGPKRTKTAETSKRSAEDDPDEGTSADTGAKRQASKLNKHALEHYTTSVTNRFLKFVDYMENTQIEETTASFVITGIPSNNDTDTIQFLKDADLLLRFRWHVRTELNTGCVDCAFNDEFSGPYLLVVFPRHTIGLRTVKRALGDLECCLTIKRIPSTMSMTEIMQALSLQVKYNVPTTLESESEEGMSGISTKRKR